MNLYYLTPEGSNTARLTEEEARHCIKVLRKKRGDEVFGIDGKGYKYRTRIKELGKGWVQLELLEKESEFGEHPFKIELAISPLRSPDRFEILCEKATELGITHITPVLTGRTVKPNIKLARLNRILISGMKQSLRSRLPELVEPLNFYDFLENTSGLKLIGQANAEKSMIEQSEIIRKADQVTLLVGPEGDFLEEEVSAARNAGFIPVSLGENRLRAETAAIMMTSAVKLIKGF